MGAQSDFISEQFVPSERHKAQQQAMANTLSAAGLNPGEFDSLSNPEETVSMTGPSGPVLIDTRPFALSSDLFPGSPRNRTATRSL
jgi:hypothetical protein